MKLLRCSRNTHGNFYFLSLFPWIETKNWAPRHTSRQAVSLTLAHPHVWKHQWVGGAASSFVARLYRSPPIQRWLLWSGSAFVMLTQCNISNKTKKVMHCVTEGKIVFRKGCDAAFSKCFLYTNHPSRGRIFSVRYHNRKCHALIIKLCAYFISPHAHYLFRNWVTCVCTVRVIPLMAVTHVIIPLQLSIWTNALVDFFLFVLIHSTVNDPPPVLPTHNKSLHCIFPLSCFRVTNPPFFLCPSPLQYVHATHLVIFSILLAFSPHHVSTCLSPHLLIYSLSISLPPYN